MAQAQQADAQDDQPHGPQIGKSHTIPALRQMQARKGSDRARDTAHDTCAESPGTAVESASAELQSPGPQLGMPEPCAFLLCTHGSIQAQAPEMSRPDGIRPAHSATAASSLDSTSCGKSESSHGTPGIAAVPGTCCGGDQNQLQAAPVLLSGRSKSRNSRRAHKRERKANASSGSDGCIVCWAADPALIFQPCGHICCCVLCAEPMLTAGTPCPICRAAVRTGIVIDTLQV